MINYELAKRLKDAGFPLHEVVTASYTDKDHGTGCLMCGFPFIEIDGNYYTRPLLSELLEECRGGFHELHWCPVGFKATEKWRWSVWGHNRDLGEFIGDTPKEAVANLWLALSRSRPRTLLGRKETTLRADD